MFAARPFALFAGFLCACGAMPENYDETGAEDVSPATGQEAINLGTAASVYRFSASLRRCGVYAHDEDFSSGRYDAHRYAFSLESHGTFTLQLARQRGSWQPALIVTTSDGEKIFDGESALSASINFVVTPEDSGREGALARVAISSDRSVELYAYVTSWEMIDARFEGGIPRTAEYSLAISEECAASSWNESYRGLDLDGSHVPRAGIANATLRRSLGVSVEPYGRVSDHRGFDFVTGTASWFGGPRDTGVTASETGAISGERLRSLNNPLNPSASTLSANPDAYYYAAMRFDYSPNGRTWWAGAKLLIMNPNTDAAIVVRPVDWGPNTSTHRVLDLSPQSFVALGVDTDDEVLVAFADPSTPLGPIH